METKEFLELYNRGILELGLLEPLQKMVSSSGTRVKIFAQSFFDLQVSGIIPQVALTLSCPRLPHRVELLIVLGFEQSKLDFILADLIDAYLSFHCEEDLNRVLDDLLSRHSEFKTEAICMNCWNHELKKIFMRAQVERASKVIVSYQDSHLVQKFISTKLVEVREAAVPAVYRTLREAISEFAKSESPVREFNAVVMPISGSSYELKTENQTLQVLFAE